MATVRQKRAISLVLNDRMSVSKAMKVAGYSPNVYNNPQELTRSKAWLETIEKSGLTDEYLTQRHYQLVKSDKEEIATRAIDLAYKVKGKYDGGTNKTQFNAPVQIVINPPREPAIEPHIQDVSIESNGV